MRNLFKKKSIDTIYLHLGMPKTGSTYLQGACAYLESKGLFNTISYPIVTPIDVDAININTGGNAYPLFNELRGDGFKNKRGVCQALESLLALRNPLKRDLLLSTERLIEMLPNRLFWLLNALASHCNNVKIIIYVRPFSSLMWSRYNEGVKTGKMSLTFSQWINSPLKGAAQLLRAVMGLGENTTVIEYNRNNILIDFLNALNEPVCLSDVVPRIVANRGLARDELNLKRLVNEVFGSQEISRAITERLVLELTDQVGNVMTETEDQMIQERWRSFKGSLVLPNTKTSRAIMEILDKPAMPAKASIARYYDEDRVDCIIKCILQTIHERSGVV